MLCTNCKSAEASFHYKQIISGKKSEQNLCHLCATKLGYLSHNENIFDIGSILNDFVSMPNALGGVKPEVVCPVCKMTYDEFRRCGLFGCDKCYEVFEATVENTLSRIQPATVHKGSLRSEEGEKIRKKNELTDLKNDLKKAIIEERYEDAALLRDKIKKLEEKENG